VLDVCQKEHIDGITSFSLESALPTVIYVATQMNLVSNSMECLELTLNKFTMRNAFEKAGIPVPRYYMVMEKGDFNNIEIRFPAIIKPVDSGGSQGVNKVNNLKELEDAYSYAKDHSRTKL
jgi:biotin carboxylase